MHVDRSTSRERSSFPFPNFHDLVTTRSRDGSRWGTRHNRSRRTNEAGQTWMMIRVLSLAILSLAPVASLAQGLRPPTEVHNRTPSWSADGSTIYFESSRDGNWELYAMNADGSGVRRITDSPTVDMTAAVSPDGTTVAYQSTDETDYDSFDVWLVGSDGSEPRPLITDELLQGRPVWSPDGRQLLYHSGETPTFHLFAMDLESGARRRVTDGEGSSDWAWWASDESIWFESNRTGSFEVYRIGPDSGPAEQLTRGGGGAPSPSHDGSRFAFQALREDDWEIYTARSDGSDVRQLTFNDVMDRLPAWSPDGTTIAFSSMRSGTEQIYLMDPDGGNVRQLTGGGPERQLTDWPGSEDHPRFSPDGDWLAFEATVDGQADLYLMRLADGEVRRLTDTPHADRRPVWSPDGKTIAYQSTRDGVTGIWSIPVEGGEPMRVFHREGTNAIAPDFGPDGRLVATVLEPNQSRTYGHATPWLMNADGSDARSLTAPGDEWYARWDAAGDWLYFYYGRADGLGAVNVETGAVRDVTRDRFVGWRPIPSPDGEHLAFVSSPGWTLWLWRLDGTAPPVPLTRVGRDDFPAFSPDGGQVAFSTDRMPSHIVELELATGSRRTLATGTDPWILDDGRIAYLTDEKPARIQILEPATGREEEIPGGTGIPYRVALSPSGERLALVSLPGAAQGGRYLYLGKGDGSRLRRWSGSNDRVETPHWCGSEASLLFSSDHATPFRQLHLLDLDSDRVTRLTESPGSKFITACADDRTWISYSYTAGRTGTGVLDRVADSWQVRFETDGREGSLAPDGVRFAEIRSEDGQVDLFLREADGAYTRLTDNPAVESNPRWARDGQRLIFASRDSNRDIWLRVLDASRPGGSFRPPGG